MKNTVAYPARPLLAPTNTASAGDFRALVAAIEASPIPAPESVAAALSAVRDGIITGEGPTTTGRIHFSRTLDGADAALVRRILIAAGGAMEAPVSRAEAEILFDIHEAALDRADGGAFDDLFAKAIAHHVLAAAGHKVPVRTVALAPATTLAGWADQEIGATVDVAWLAARMRRTGPRSGALAAIAALLIGAAPVAMSLRAVLDLAT